MILAAWLMISLLFFQFDLVSLGHILNKMVLRTHNEGNFGPNQLLHQSFTCHILNLHFLYWENSIIVNASIIITVTVKTLPVVIPIWACLVYHPSVNSYCSRLPIYAPRLLENNRQVPHTHQLKSSILWDILDLQCNVRYYVTISITVAL